MHYAVYVCMRVNLIKMSMEICLFYRFMNFNINLMFTELAQEADLYIMLNSRQREVFLYEDYIPYWQHRLEWGDLPIEILKFMTPSQVHVQGFVFMIIRHGFRDFSSSACSGKYISRRALLLMNKPSVGHNENVIKTGQLDGSIRFTVPIPNDLRMNSTYWEILFI